MYEKNDRTIVVNFEYAVTNGLCGMKRDVVLKLCRLMWYNKEKIVVMIGMCEEHFIWKEHHFFMKSRPQKISVTFRPAADGCVITQIPIGLQCVFPESGSWKTVFLDTAIVKGIYVWTVQINYGNVGKKSNFFFGTTSSDDLNTSNISHDKNGCSLVFYRYSTGVVEKACLYGVAGYFYNTETKVPDRSLVALEANADARTLSFFVDGQKLVHAISNLRMPVHLAMTGSGHYAVEQSFASIAFRRLQNPTPSPVTCMFHKQAE